MCLGLATGYIKPKEERATSLLKPYTITVHLSKLKDKNQEQANKLKSVMRETLAKISSSMEVI